MQNNAPAGIRTRVAQLGTVHDNPYTTGAHASTVGTTTFGWDRTPGTTTFDRDRTPIGTTTFGWDRTPGLGGIDTVGTTTFGWDRNPGLGGIEPLGSNPRHWRNGDRSYPNGIETLDSAFAVDRQKTTPGRFELPRENSQ